MQPVLCLWEYQRLQPVNNFRGHFVAAVSRQTVHEHSVEVLYQMRVRVNRQWNIAQRPGQINLVHATGRFGPAPVRQHHAA